jgi:hypothetical protein
VGAPASCRRGLAVDDRRRDRDGRRRAARELLGRWLWDLFARSIHAVPAPSVPVVSVTLIALGALVLANVVAALPGRLAARTPAALLLHSE